MNTREQGARRVATLTTGIVVAGVIGAAITAGAAYSATQESRSGSTGTSTESTDDDGGTTSNSNNNNNSGTSNWPGLSGGSSGGGQVSSGGS